MRSYLRIMCGRRAPMLFEPPRHDSILRRRLAGLSASAALHLFPLAIAALPASQPRIDQARREPAIVVTAIPPDVTAGDAASGDEPLEDRPPSPWTA
jgi:hypothetical protein